MARPKFSVFLATDGFRWRLKAANGEIVATGEAHTRRRDARRAIRGVFWAALRAMMFGA